MAELQKYFEQFHGKIRLDYDSNAQLAQKRDIVLDKIAAHLKKNERPSFERLLQGSYKMRTGVFPLGQNEYDIDVGLVFSFETGLPPHANPRAWVYEAIKSHTDQVKEKTPCIRVHYKDDYPYHLDLVVYGRLPNEGSKLHLATKDGWVDADPETLLKHVRDAQARFPDTSGSTGIDVLRRCVRYLKRWGDVRTVNSNHERPTGLAYTLLAIDKLGSGRNWDGTLDDASELKNLASTASTMWRVAAQKPTPQYEDMFGKLDDEAMKALKNDLSTMASTINDAQAEPDPHEACTALARIFGEDFPVPDKDGTGKKSKSPAIVTSSSSA